LGDEPEMLTSQNIDSSKLIAESSKERITRGKLGNEFELVYKGKKEESQGVFAGGKKPKAGGRKNQQ
jgi:hypothetical protein